MWLICAFGSAFFAGITAILSKIGVEDVNSNIATAIRTAVVFVVSWLLVLALGVQAQIPQIGVKTMVFLILSGLATGASWLCYYRALKDGAASIVVPIDKLSILVTILFSCIILREKLTAHAAAGLLLLVGGTLLLLYPDC